MDLVFVALVVTLVVALLLLYRVNSVSRTDDLETLYGSIVRRSPTTVAFSLGRSGPTTFANVVLSNDRPVIRRRDKYPLNSLGEIIPTADAARGQIIAPPSAGSAGHYEGFELVGMGRFECPDGYAGPTCALKPLCGESPHYEHHRALDYEHFNALGLYGPANSGSAGNAAARQQFHARIRVHCRDDGTYELQVCPDNELLDTQTARCRPYDICRDKPRDFKHRYAISEGSESLTKHEYYMCDENRHSRLKRCHGDLVFSTEHHSCINPNACVGLGRVTILQDPPSERSFIQCSHDNARVVECDPALGIDHTDPKQLRCRVRLDVDQTAKCTPQIYRSTTTDGVSYDSGALLCDPYGKFESVVSCSGSSERVSTHEWGDRFTISIEAFPSSVYSEARRGCVSTSDERNVRGTTLSRHPVRWSQAMRDQHPYDIVERRFVCSEPGSYRWDYEANASVPPHDPTRQFLDSGTPCHANGPVPLEQAPWSLAPIVKYPLHGRYPPMLVSEALGTRRIALDSWPIAVIGRAGPYGELRIRGARFDALRWDMVERELYLETYSSESADDSSNAPLPLGFDAPPADSSSSSRGGITSNAVTMHLSLVGLAEQVPASVLESSGNAPALLWYTIATGRFDRVRFYEDDDRNDDMRVKREPILVPRRIDLRVDGKYNVATPFVSRRVSINDGRIVVTSAGIAADGTNFAARLHSFEVESMLPGLIRIVINGQTYGGMRPEPAVLEFW